MWNMPYHVEHHLYPSIPFQRCAMSSSTGNIAKHHGRIVKTTGDGMLVVPHGSRPGLSHCVRADARQLRQRARDCCSRLDAPQSA
jgi:hypothetical protein